MNFDKIKIKPSDRSVTLQWSEPSVVSEDADKHKLECHDAPEQSMIDAFYALTPYFLDLLELPDDYATSLVVCGVTIKTGAGGDTSYILTAQKALEDFDSPVVLNTPLIAYPARDLHDALDALELEAEKYVNGERGQMSLFKGVGPGGEEEDDDVGEKIDELLDEIDALDDVTV